MFSLPYTLDSLIKIQKQYTKQCIHLLSSYCFTANETIVLMFLINNPQYTLAKDISFYRAISKGHVAKSVESLTSKGYLKQAIDKEDKRCVHLVLTKQCSTIIQIVTSFNEHYKRTMTQDITQQEFQTFSKVLDQLKINLERSQYE